MKNQNLYYKLVIHQQASMANNKMNMENQANIADKMDKDKLKFAHQCALGEKGVNEIDRKVTNKIRIDLISYLLLTFFQRF